MLFCCFFKNYYYFLSSNCSLCEPFKALKIWMIPKFWPIVEREWGWIDLYISKTQNILSIWASDLYGHMFYFIYIPKYSVYFVFCCQRFPDDKVWSLSEHNWISVTQKRFLSFAGNRPWKRSHYIYHPERRSKQRLWSLPNVSCR